MHWSIGKWAVVMQTGQVGNESRATAPVRYSLPPDTVVFTGRAGEVEFITGAVATVATRGGVLSCAIDGMPGLGKTALAIHVAHLLRRQFADRQLFIDLHGHTPGQLPVAPEAALASLLAELEAVAAGGVS